MCFSSWWLAGGCGWPPLPSLAGGCSSSCCLAAGCAGSPLPAAVCASVLRDFAALRRLSSSVVRRSSSFGSVWRRRSSSAASLGSFASSALVRLASCSALAGACCRPCCAAAVGGRSPRGPLLALLRAARLGVLPRLGDVALAGVLVGDDRDQLVGQVAAPHGDLGGQVLDVALVRQRQPGQVEPAVFVAEEHDDDIAVEDALQHEPVLGQRPGDRLVDRIEARERVVDVIAGPLRDVVDGLVHRDRGDLRAGLRQGGDELPVRVVLDVRGHRRPVGDQDRGDGWREDREQRLEPFAGERRDLGVGQRSACEQVAVGVLRGRGGRFAGGGSGSGAVGLRVVGPGVLVHGGCLCGRRVRRLPRVCAPRSPVRPGRLGRGWFSRGRRRRGGAGGARAGSRCAAAEVAAPPRASSRRQPMWGRAPAGPSRFRLSCPRGAVRSLCCAVGTGGSVRTACRSFSGAVSLRVGADCRACPFPRGAGRRSPVAWRLVPSVRAGTSPLSPACTLPPWFVPRRCTRGAGASCAAA